MQKSSDTLYINHLLLPELRLLFEAHRGNTLANGNADAGFNCYAKAFVSVYLARLQGLPASLCEGRALLAWVRPQPCMAYRIDPHAWAGLPGGRVLDLSINHFDGRKYFTTGHCAIHEAEPIAALATSEALRFDTVMNQARALPFGVHLFYHLVREYPFEFERLQIGAEAVNSPPTRALAANRGAANLLARAILHLHGLLTDKRAPLPTAVQAEAWEMLAAWDVDAVAELKTEWHAVNRGAGLSTFAVAMLPFVCP